MQAAAGTGREGARGSGGAEAGAESQGQDLARRFARVWSSPPFPSPPFPVAGLQMTEALRGDSSLTPAVQREPTEVRHPPGPRAHRPPPPDPPGAPASALAPPSPHTGLALCWAARSCL